MKIKIFQANWPSEVETEVNKWLEENPNIEIVDIKPFATVMQEMYIGQSPIICNQWCDYTWTVIYQDKIRNNFKTNCVPIFYINHKIVSKIYKMFFSTKK